MKENKGRNVADNKELEQIFKSGIGFVFNDFTASPDYGIKWNKLHKATCSCKLKVEGKGRKLPKIFFDTYDDAHEWLKTNRNKVGYSDCDKCIG